MPSIGGDPRNRGASAVEFALIVPLFLLILLFMVDAGRALFVQAALQDSAHQGARAAAIGASSLEVTSLAQQTGQAAVAMAASGPAPVAVSLLLPCPASYSPLALNRATVQTSITFTFFTPLALIQQFDPGSTRPGTMTITQQAQWLCEG